MLTKFLAKVSPIIENVSDYTSNAFHNGLSSAVGFFHRSKMICFVSIIACSAGSMGMKIGEINTRHEMARKECGQHYFFNENSETVCLVPVQR